MAESAEYICYEIARSLNKNEWNRIVREVKNGIRTQHADTQAYVAAIAQHYPAFEISDESIFQKAFPGEPYSNPRIRVLRTYLKKVLEDFLIESAQQNAPSTREYFYVRSLLDRNCPELARLVLASYFKKGDSNAFSVDDLLHEFSMEEMNLELYIRENRRTNGYDWEGLLRKLDQFSITQKLRLLCAIKSESNFVTRETPEFHVQLAGIRAEVDRIGTDRIPILGIFYQLLLLITEANYDPHFLELQRLLAEYGPGLSKNERLNVYGLIINFLNYSERCGMPNSLRYMFQSHQEMTRQDLVFGAGGFSVNSVRNIITSGARLGEIAWCWKFLEEARNRIPSPESDKFYYYAAAYLEFTGKNYAKAKRNLVQSELADPFNKIANDFLLLRICYDSGEDDLFLSLHASLSRQLYRKDEVANAYRQSLLNCLKILLKIFELRGTSPKSAEIKNLKKQLDGFEVMMVREWILEKIEELG